MILLGELRIALVTTTYPFLKFVNYYKRFDNREDKTLNDSLKRFFIDNPRIAVLGLNPHAGENGLLGKRRGDYNLL